MSIAVLREGIAVNLRRIPGLRVSANVPEQPQPPMAVVVPQRIEFDTAMRRGADTFTFQVLVIASRQSERSAQTTLDALCASTGSMSVKTAIESDKTLGGEAFDLRVTEMGDYGPLQIGDITYLAATFNVTVLAN